MTRPPSLGKIQLTLNTPEPYESLKKGTDLLVKRRRSITNPNCHSAGIPERKETKRKAQSLSNNTLNKNRKL